MRNLIRLLLVVFLTACGSINPPPSQSEPDSTNPNFRAANVTIDTDAVTLAGTLLVPLDDRPAPAVIIIPGSGAATRNGSWNMYRNLGEYLAERGIAVLRYDKRGVGGSTGIGNPKPLMSARRMWRRW